MAWKIKYLIFVVLIQLTKQDEVPKDIQISTKINTEDPVTKRPVEDHKQNEEYDQLAEHINDFGLTILNKMIEMNKGKNIVISPTTISSLLAMTLLGSVGVTFEEIVKVIGFSSDVLSYRKRHTQFGQLLESLTLDNETKTLFANAIFADQNTQLRQIYKEFTEKVYRGNISNIDFKNTSVSLDIINKWVSEHTNEKIPLFLEDPLPLDTKVVLLSALYFSGQWEKPFAPDQTANMTFTKEDGEKIEAELMLNFGHFNFLFSEELDSYLIALPYRGRDTIMYGLKPRKPQQLTLPDLLKKINAKKLDKLIESSRPSPCVVRFPKMHLTYRTDLSHVLKLLGIKTMFGSEANFGLMVDADGKVDDEEEKLVLRTGVEGENYIDALSRLPNPGVHVDSIIHEVQMTINEFGTEATAVGSGILSRTAKLFLTDSPFYMFIRNEKTKLITFSAAIFDPTK